MLSGLGESQFITVSHSSSQETETQGGRRRVDRWRDGLRAFIPSVMDGESVGKQTVSAVQKKLMELKFPREASWERRNESNNQRSQGRKAPRSQQGDLWRSSAVASSGAEHCHSLVNGRLIQTAPSLSLRF